MSEQFNILAIEDDENTFNAIKHGLSSGDYKVWRVSTGREALKLIKETYFIMVVTETHISDMDGIELISRLKKTDYRINVIALTTYSFLDSAIRALKAGAYAYLLKPINTEELQLMLQRAVQNSCLLIQAGKRKFYQDMSILDGLTGIYNHRHFHEMLNWQIAHLRRAPQSFSLFMIDIDSFKKFNDTHGHLEGDKVLHNAAQLFVSSTRENDLVFRYGGEEFSVILAATGQQLASRAGERLVEGARVHLPVTISIGLATFPDDSQAKDELITKADQALYRAKRLGKDRVCVYDEKLDRA